MFSQLLATPLDEKISALALTARSIRDLADLLANSDEVKKIEQTLADLIGTKHDVDSMLQQHETAKAQLDEQAKTLDEQHATNIAAIEDMRSEVHASVDVAAKNAQAELEHDRVQFEAYKNQTEAKLADREQKLTDRVHEAMARDDKADAREIELNEKSEVQDKREDSLNKWEQDIAARLEAVSQREQAAFKKG